MESESPPALLSRSMSSLGAGFQSPEALFSRTMSLDPSSKPEESEDLLQSPEPKVTTREVFFHDLEPEKKKYKSEDLLESPGSPMGVAKILKPDIAEQSEGLAQSEIHNSSVGKHELSGHNYDGQDFKKFMFGRGWAQEPASRRAHTELELEADMTARVLAALGVTDVGKEVVHFKGFALSGENKLVEDQQQIEEIAAYLSTFKVVCYDGDDFMDKGKGSFVTVLVYLMNNYPSVHVIAFKKSGEVEEFKEHLNNLWEPLYSQDPHWIDRDNVLNVDDEDDREFRAIASHVVLADEFWQEEDALALEKLASKQPASRQSIILLEVGAQLEIEGLRDYQVFGVQIIHHYTRAKQVYVLGGGQTSYIEYGWLPKDIHWHYFPAVRKNNKTGTTEASVFEFIRALPAAPGNFHVHDNERFSIEERNVSTFLDTRLRPSAHEVRRENVMYLKGFAKQYKHMEPSEICESLPEKFEVFAIDAEDIIEEGDTIVEVLRQLSERSTVTILVFSKSSQLQPFKAKWPLPLSEVPTIVGAMAAHLDEDTQLATRNVIFKELAKPAVQTFLFEVATERMMLNKDLKIVMPDGVETDPLEIKEPFFEVYKMIEAGEAKRVERSKRFEEVDSHWKNFGLQILEYTKASHAFVLGDEAIEKIGNQDEYLPHLRVFQHNFEQ